MAALEPRPARGHHPSDSLISDTSNASSELVPGSIPHSSRPPPLSLTRKQDDHPVGSSRPLPSPRSGRSQSLAAQASPTFAPAPIKRKPLSATASPLAVSYTTGSHLDILRDLPGPEQRFSRSFSVDSPTLYEFPERTASSTSAAKEQRLVEATFLRPCSPDSEYSESEVDAYAGDRESRNIPDEDPAAPQTGTSDTSSEHEDLIAAYDVTPTPTEDLPTDPITAADLVLPARNNRNTNSTMSLVSRKNSPPHLSLAPVESSTEETANTRSPDKGDIHKPLPKSPASSKLGTFFGWGTSSPSNTEFSDKGISPLPSPFSGRQTTAYTDDSTVSGRGPLSARTDVTERNPLDYCEAYLQTPPAVTPTPPVQIEEMEDELKAISAELAASIRREMDLEDLVDRLQAEVNNPQAPGKRSSDYFSDSGYSSAKFSEYDASKEEVAQIQRRSEQEKAQIRLELTDKLSDERARRKLLDQQIKELSEKASHLDMAQMRSQDASGRIKDLENSCEVLRRRLSEEKQVKDNFEDLLSALRGELENASNERDNLRDEIVPQLRARVEGLEAQSAEHTKLAYESTKMQQELQNLRTENTTLKSSQPEPDRRSLGRSKSNSVTAPPPFKLQQAPLSRSNTVKGQTESREALVERLKDVEAQRDALHNALKNLLDRQEFQNRENDKKIKVLEVERERLLSGSPRKAGYEKEVSNLRAEINVLRRRAEEAIEQKWQVEKGLGGLKMDLDRAEQEIAGLRALLKEKDILIPAALPRSSASSHGSADGSSGPVTSNSLTQAYEDLQKAYADALERIKSLELGSGASASQDEKTQLAMERLEQSLAASVSERDLARSEANAYRDQVESLQTSEKRHLETEQDLASQLEESARRVEELAQQVRNQLAANADLRMRLNETVARGDAAQKTSKERIAAMQVRLKTLEDQLVATQTAAEERVARHEDELSTLKDAHSAQLQRLRDSSGGLRSPRQFAPKSPLSPLFANGAKSPRLLSPRPSPRRSNTSPVGEVAVEELGQVENLRARVAELEMALTGADAEMQEVVGRMNSAQIEVMQLQEEREEAVRETKRLQRQLEEEKVRAFEQRFKSLTGSVAV
ncbi:uncharacterized protein E0L32_011065 [Thyridium curvatum]|uniref:DUF7603 domain-containing protein n=1 Tax=Thyridium curvatum TaxID=1093900 RepID=A0A507AJI8_9PEZI|nr:uncharacterized protein E0L32_011065 [Thyridium curvatum]TPX06997.1 hypothetical protein E0L32_011065 [Thyridium curvatum]